MKYVPLLAFALAITAPAFADEHADVVEKCTAAMNSIEAENVDAGCVCFADALSEEEREAYNALDLTTWDEAASDSLKEKGAMCFPPAEE